MNSRGNEHHHHDRVGALSRRTLTSGAAWSVPVVALATTALAYAASPCAGACYRLDWDSATQGFTTHTPADPNANWTRTGATTSTTTGCTRTTAVTVAQNRTGGVSMPWTTGGQSSRSDAHGDFSIGTRFSSSSNVDGASPGLVLVQAATDTATIASETVTFTFTRPVSTVSFTVYDWTTATGTTAGSYDDRFAFSVPATVARSSSTQTGSRFVTTNDSTRRQARPPPPAA